ncbi:hypothetical protein [Stenotrophomonas sp. LMG 10879]|uniref:hypothetical protein n=1 Tax=Stenotrophomonas sp. LMG 10879 TaxID=487706 RepID=UPI001FAED7F3|nr:hypothetical protein [Stenotrophomonas sp. LMG 10879]
MTGRIARHYRQRGAVIASRRKLLITIGHDLLRGRGKTGEYSDRERNGQGATAGNGVLQGEAPCKAPPCWSLTLAVTIEYIARQLRRNVAVLDDT